MGRGALIKTSFNAGELSPLLDGRSDLAKYPHGCSVLENFIPTAQGPIYKRPGTRFVEDAGNESPVLVPFIYNRTQTYILAIGSSIAVYSDRGRVLDGDGDPYSFGSGTWTAPPRRADGTSRLSYTQSGDVLFVCDAEGGLPLMQIQRTGNAAWSISAYELRYPPTNEWENGGCVLFKKKKDGTVAPTGQYYIAVDIGTISCDYSFDVYIQETVHLEPTDNTNNFLKDRRRGKLFLDFGARPQKDYGAQPAAPPFNGAYITENPGRIVKWTSGNYIQHGQIVMNGGRFYEPKLEGVVTDAPFHTSARETNDTGLFYLGNGVFCFEILESGIEDFFVESDGTENKIYCALVKMADHPDDMDDIGQRVFERYTCPMTQTIGDHQAKSASVHFKCTRWAKASVRDFIPEIMVTPLPLIGELPDNVGIFRERLVLSQNRNLYASVAGDFPNFSSLDGSGQVVADMALNLDLLAGDLSPVSWMAPAERLLLGSFGGERVIGEQNQSNAFGPLNVKVDVSNSNGSIDVGPEVIGSDVIFVDASGHRVRRTNLVQADDADLNEMADHIAMQSPFVGMAYQRSPSSVVWFILKDGSLVGMTYNRGQDVASWHRHDIGGVVKSICCIPSPDGTRDDLWLVVERTINGGTKRYVEVMPDEFRSGLRAVDARHLDCSLIYDGPPATVFTGMAHLENELVSIVADGIYLGKLMVVAGTITLPEAYSVVVVGLHHISRCQTMRLHVGSDDGVNMGKTMRVSRASVRAMDTVGFKIGWAFDKLERKEFKDATQNMDEAVPAQTIERSFSFPGNYDGDGYVCIEQDQPLPCTITALAIQFEVH